MASSLKLFLFAAVLACISLDGAKARPLASFSNLSARSKLDVESPNCWDSLFQLQACTGEIVLFFLDGFTTEESQILEGYCDKAADSTTPSPSAPSVVPVKVVPKKTWVP
ncbi:hypothetical protein OIU77_026542 [Salix suchowensis]|uniref:Prolamin-like domain-containing protein n=1 Tax=Salix suchowensis TaxID=1278906 RepID=A0ABQ9BNM3_9ROSI|nr:hypothetical protein OIU77_026542 [Salix suchowensis]